MKPLTGVARNMARTLSRCGGFFATVSAGNQRDTVGSTSASMPFCCATAMRSSHCWLDLRRRLAGRVADDDAIEAVGMALGEAERGGAAHGQAGEVRLLDRQRVHQTERIGKQRIERIAAGRHVGAAVAALVVAQHAE